jgi:hypothetical protein
MGAAAHERLTPAERRLLAACLLARRPAGALARLATAGVDWDRVLAAAAGHAVAEALAHALHEDGVAPCLPPGPRAAVEDLHQHAAAKNALLLHDLARVQALLDEAAIPSVALKGAALLAAHYPAPAARHVGDIDLLVRPADLLRAAEALAAAGLGGHPANLPAMAGEGAGAGRPTPISVHLLPLASPAGFAVELHDRSPGPGPRAEEILARARPCAWQGHRLALTDPGDLAGMLCAHVFEHHRGDWRFRARHVADLEAIEAASGPIDWALLRTRYDDRPAREARALLEAARREAAGGPRAPRRHGLLDERGRWDRLAGALRGHHPVVEAWEVGGPRAALRLFLPTRRYMEARYGVRPGSPVVLLLYPLRLARALVRKVLFR